MNAPPPRSGRLLVDPPQDGAWNMAVDDLLLESAAESGIPSLRFYGWAEPTLSLGYFQAYADRFTHQASRQSALIRRSSGGGAILHDRELTYSLAMPWRQGLAGDSAWLYTAAHEALIETLAGLGIAAVQSGPAPTPPDREQPFLCFLRRSPVDVLVGGSKVCGSAQRRRRGAILQHGSLILGRSPAAPELPGLADLGPVCVTTERLISAWSQALSFRLGLQFVDAPPEPAVVASARSLALAKYKSPQWTQRR
jgi:lipoate-protein ligase A